MNQSQVALFNQVEQRQTTIDVTPRNPDHQAKIAFDHALPCGFVAVTRLSRKGFFFIRTEERRDPNLVEVLSCWVQQLSHDSPLLLQVALHVARFISLAKTVAG